MTTLTARISNEIDTAKRSAWRQRALAVELALAANVLILVVARLVNGDYPIVTTGGDDQEIGFVPVIVVTVLTGLAAWGLLALLERLTSRAGAIWTAVAFGIVVLSLVGPLGSGTDTASKIVLTSLHLASAALIIPVMRKSAGLR